jgi:hypothetical protein
MGHRVGALAQTRYPGGVAIDDDPLHHAQAVEQTREALAIGAPAIYEAAFTHDNVKVRADILRRLDGGGHELIEVKSTGSYSEAKHLPDVGIQLHVLLGCGVDVRRVSLMHLNRRYVYPGGEHEPRLVFDKTDVTREAFDYVACVPGALATMMETLALPEPPEITCGPACTKPYDCGFIGWCTRDEPEPDYSGDVRTDHAVLRCLDRLRFPLYFVDFETVGLALPIFPGTSPFQPVRVQWSLHALHEDGSLEHAEWLADTSSRNPDPEFMRTLLDALGTEGTFVHYSPYERTQLIDIAWRYPSFRQPLVERIPCWRDKLAEKLAASGESLPAPANPAAHGLAAFDLGLSAVSKGCIHPQLGSGQYTIKTAIKLLARDLPPYEGLAISNGDQAMVATVEMLTPQTTPQRAEQIRRDLLEYCGQDTLAMVEIYRTLRELRG